MKNYKKGFTLIELLVVIAIIGILSSIVLASLSSARSKGEDAAIQSTVSNMRAQAELYYSNVSNYGTTTGATVDCSVANSIFASTLTGSLKSLVTDLKSKAGSANVACISTASSGSDATNWVVTAKLKSPIGSNTHFCADNSGNAVATTAAAVAATTVCK